jgi:uncharacterized membrane protein YeaQ/YmgE (transglycosylase-associated protein family)
VPRGRGFDGTVAPEVAAELALQLQSSAIGRQQPRETRMGIVIALIIGLIAGAIAKLLMPGRDPGGIIVTMLLGVAGSVVAYLLGRVFGWYDQPDEGPGILASILGAMLLLGIYRMAVRRRRLL